jgi:hypothetical protein
MKITIEVPEMQCTKCSTTAAIRPVFLYVKGGIPPQFRGMLSDVVKELADVSASDDHGFTWEGFSDDKPAGWTKGPEQSVLCASCTALWGAAVKAFLVPLPPPPAVEASLEPEALPPPPKHEHVASKQSLTDILAVRQYDNSTPTMNSMMPMTVKR